MSNTTLWLHRPPTNPNARLRLFCFPYAGGGASVYRTWQEKLPPQIELCAVQLPGRERRLREPPCTQLPVLVETLVQALLPYFKELPFGLFGHSMGGLISFELARELRRAHQLEPVHLFVSGSCAPQLRAATITPIYHLSEPEFVAELRRYGGTPETVFQNKELMELFLPLLRADMTLNDTYRYSPQPRFRCAINAFGGQRDCQTSEYQISGWEQQTNSNFKLKMYPGNHFFLNEEHPSMLKIIADELADHIQ